MSSSPPPSPSQDGPLQRFSFAVCVCGVIGVRCVSLRARVAVARLCLGAREGWARLPGVLPSPLGAAAAATPARLSLSLSLSLSRHASRCTHTHFVYYSKPLLERVKTGFFLGLSPGRIGCWRGSVCSTKCIARSTLEGAISDAARRPISDTGTSYLAVGARDYVVKP